MFKIVTEFNLKEYTKNCLIFRRLETKIIPKGQGPHMIPY